MCVNEKEKGKTEKYSHKQTNNNVTDQTMRFQFSLSSCNTFIKPEVVETATLTNLSFPRLLKSTRVAAYGIEWFYVVGVI